MTSSTDTGKDITELPIAALSVMAENRTSGMDVAAIAELIADVKVRGVLQPLVVRNRHTDKYEVVCGARRLAAAVGAGLKVVPVVVKAMTDDQAAAARASENLNRVNLHPIEEATIYNDLVRREGGRIHVVAAALGKSEAHVRARLKLLDLTPKVRKALEDRKISVAAAFTIARLGDPAAMDQVLAEALREGDGQTEEATAVRLTKAIVDAHMHDLARAPFDVKDATLPGPGGKPAACVGCRFATTAAPMLFGDLDKTARCTNPGCWRGRCTASTERTLQEFKKAGRKVLPANAANLFQPDRMGRGLAELDYDAHRTWRTMDERPFQYDGGDWSTWTLKAIVAKAVADKKVPNGPAIMAAVVVAVDREGKVRELLPRPIADKVIAKYQGRRHSDGSPSSSTGPNAALLARRAVMKRAYWPGVRDLAAHLLTLPVPRLIAAAHALGRPHAYDPYLFEVAKCADPKKMADRTARSKADREAVEVANRVLRAPKDDRERLVALLLSTDWTGAGSVSGPGHMAEDFDEAEYALAKAAGFDLKKRVTAAAAAIAKERTARTTKPAGKKKGGRS